MRANTSRRGRGPCSLFLGQGCLQHYDIHVEVKCSFCLSIHIHQCSYLCLNSIMHNSICFHGLPCTFLRLELSSFVYFFMNMFIIVILKVRIL